MAPFIPVNKVVRVRLTWEDDVGTPHGIRQFYAYPGSAPTAGDLNTYASTVFSNAVSNLAPYMTENKTITEVVVEDLTSDTAANGSYTGSSTGTLVGQYLPASVCVIGLFSIDRRYRGGHGRTALPLGDQGALQNPQQWASTPVTGFTGALTGYAVGNAGTQWSGSGLLAHVIVSYRLDNAPRATPTTYPVVGYSVNVRVGSQRRRLGRSSA